MANNTPIVPVAGPTAAKLPGIVAGEERFAFLYAVIGAIAVAIAMTCSGIAGLSWLKTTFVLIGALLVSCAILFSVLEVRRVAQSPKEKADEARIQEENPYGPQTVVVAPPTSDACVHHEYYRESQGFDQGQLTSQIPDSTPLIEAFLNRGREKKRVV